MLNQRLDESHRGLFLELSDYTCASNFRLVWEKSDLDCVICDLFGTLGSRYTYLTNEKPYYLSRRTDYRRSCIGLHLHETTITAGRPRRPATIYGRLVCDCQYSLLRREEL